MNCIVLYTSRCFAFLPMFKHQSFNVLYGISVLFLFVIYTVVAIWIETAYLIVSLTYTVYSLSLLPIVIIIWKTTIQNNEYTLIEKNMDYIERCRKQARIGGQLQKSFLLVIAVYTMLITVMACRFLVTYQGPLFISLLMNAQVHIILLNCELLKYVEEMYKLVQETAEHYVLFLEQARTYRNTNMVLSKIEQKSNSMLQMLIKVDELCDYLNRHFQWPILFIFICIISHVLIVFRLAIVVGTGNELSLLYFINFISLVFVSLVPIKSEHVHVARDAMQIAVQQMYNRFSRLDVLSEKIDPLLEQSRNAPVQFTLAGFMTMNYFMLFTMTNLMVSYMVAIYQFTTN